MLVSHLMLLNAFAKHHSWPLIFRQEEVFSSYTHYHPSRYCVHGPRHRDVVEELMRREVEHCDMLAGFIPIMSVAGGTGSGVGTFVTQCLRDAYPSSFVLNHLTWPYGTGEVCHYYLPLLFYSLHSWTRARLSCISK